MVFMSSTSRDVPRAPGRSDLTGIGYRQNLASELPFRTRIPSWGIEQDPHTEFRRFMREEPWCCSTWAADRDHDALSLVHRWDQRGRADPPRAPPGPRTPPTPAARRRPRKHLPRERTLAAEQGESLERRCRGI